MEKTYNTDNSESLEQLNSQTILFVHEKVQRLENLKKKEEGGNGETIRAWINNRLYSQQLLIN